MKVFKTPPVITIENVQTETIVDVPGYWDAEINHEEMIGLLKFVSGNEPQKIEEFEFDGGLGCSAASADEWIVTCNHWYETDKLPRSKGFA